MKQILTFCLTIFFVTNLLAQTDTTQKRFRHEFGIDVSSILGGILVATDFGFTTTELHKYPLSYRLYTPILNLRTGIGISSAEEVYSVFNSTGLDTLEGNDFVVNGRIGLERMQEIGKRWAFYYGIDYEYSQFDDFRQTKSASQGYITDWIIKNYQHGIAPVLGFRLNFNNRVGLQTELRFVYSIFQQDFSRNHIPVAGNTTNLPDDEKSFRESTNFEFEAPNFLVITVKL